MKTLAALIVAAMLVAPMGCRNKNPAGGGQGVKKPGELKVLCTFLPVWIFTRNVVGNRPGVAVDVLIPGHQGPHDYQLTPGDMTRIANADLFVANGLYLDEFITDTVRKARPGLRIVEAADGVTPISSDDQGFWNQSDSATERFRLGINPHAFASPGQAARMVDRIAGALADVDPAGAADYQKNARDYAARLTALAADFKAAAAAAPDKKIVTFHNSFDYLARDTGLTVAGVIESVPGQEPAAGELARLAAKIRSARVAAIFSEPQYSPRLAQVLSAETGVKVYELDPVATGNMEPDYYEKTMRKNLQTLKQALGADPAP
ncbi:MAG TPA: metal ABC transporter substrate-binding protein [bacterium]|nr:metal ABC transporter substrate-binding protein [bacterium]